MPSTLGVVASHRSALTGPWTPAALPNLRGWYDADDAATFTYSSGTVVSQWRDKSGNAKHATQGVVANQPNRNGSQNFRTCVTFDGVDDILQATGVFSTATWDAANPHSVIVVAKNTNAAGGGLKTAWGADETRVFRDDPGSNAAVYGNSAIVSSLVSWASTIRVVATRHTGSSSTSGISVNGGAWTTGGIGVGAGTILSIGGRQRGGELWGGTICEVVAMSSTITDADYAKLVNYLTAKWITSPIPTTGLVGWWDASDAGTITAAAGKVSQWANKVGAPHWTQANATYQPQTGVNTMNGKNVLTFPDTAGAYMDIASNPCAGAAGGTLFWVVKNTRSNATQSGAPVSGLGLGATDDFYTYSTGQPYLRFGSTARPATGSPGDLRVAHVAALRSAPSSWEWWRNGVSEYSNTSNVVGWTNVVSSIRLGQGVDSATYAGDVAEVILYNQALSTVERQQVESYLKGRWGTP